MADRSTQVKNFLKISGTKIIDGSGRAVRLAGVNLGGWLMMEGYILCAPNRAEQLFKKRFAKTLDPKSLREFEKNFRARFGCCLSAETDNFYQHT